MDWGALLAAATAPMLAIVSSILGLRLANRLGIGPVQGQYVEILGKLNEAKDERIAQLESEDSAKAKRIEHLEAQVETLEGKVDDLEQTVWELRQELSKRPPRPRRRRPESP